MEFEWLTEEFIYLAHKRQIAEHGGSDGIRDKGLLLSALARPQNLHAYGEDVDLAALAASYAFGIAKNHPFIDGNKRTALVACITFLRLNGTDVSVDMPEAYTTFLGVADGTVSEDELAQWLRDRATTFTK